MNPETGCTADAKAWQQHYHYKYTTNSNSSAVHVCVHARPKVKYQLPFRLHLKLDIVLRTVLFQRGSVPQ
jgi:hypothetical protein